MNAKKPVKSTSITKKNRATPKPSTQPEKYRAGILWGSWKAIAPSEEFLKSLAYELVKWVRIDQEAFRVEQFLAERELHFDTFMSWTKKSEDLSRAYDMAKMVIANRREVGSILRRYDASSVLNMMPFYDKNWEAIAEWRTKIKNPEASTTTLQIIEIPVMESSDMVPVKKGKEE